MVKILLTSYRKSRRRRQLQCKLLKEINGVVVVVRRRQQKK